MKMLQCKFLPAVQKALKSGIWDDVTRQHLSSCPECLEEARIQGWLQRFAGETPEETPPASPHLIWLKAQLTQKQEAHKRALRPLVFIQMVTEIFVGLVLSIGALLKWREIEIWVDNLTVASPGAVFDGGSMVAALFLLVILLGVGMLTVFNSFAHGQ